jgi:hypothetical protein
MQTILSCLRAANQDCPFPEVLQSALYRLREERFNELRLLNYTYYDAPSAILDLMLLSAREWRKLMKLSKENFFQLGARHWLAMVVSVALSKKWLVGTSEFEVTEETLINFVSKRVFIEGFLSQLRSRDPIRAYGDVELMARLKRPLKGFNCTLTLDELQHLSTRGDPHSLNQTKNEEEGFLMEEEELAVSPQPIVPQLPLQRARLPVFLEFLDEEAHTQENLTSLPDLEVEPVTGAELEADWGEVTAVELLFHDSKRIRFAFEQGMF